MEIQQRAMAEVSTRDFNRLITDLLQGRMQRNGFRRWEIEILLDLETCKLRRSTRRETLRRYQQAMLRRLEDGEPIQLLSAFLEARRRRRRLAALREPGSALANLAAEVESAAGPRPLPLRNVLAAGAILRPRLPAGTSH